MTQSAPGQHASEGPAPLDESSRRVLVVDDDAGMCELIAASLGKVFHITWKTSVEEALTEVAASDFDVIITDLRMPARAGWSSAAASKSSGRTCLSS